MCKGKSTSATKIQNAAESLFSKSKYLYGTFYMSTLDKIQQVYNHSKW